MKLGAIFPQTEIGNDPAALRDYAQAAEGLGFDHILVFDHVVGADPARFEQLGLRAPYTYRTPFHEPMVLFGFLAAVTQRVELVSGIIILPQRQTVLVAKQAAEVDVLTGGRLRLGVGIGWNPVEYEALGESFKNRGRRVEEQIAVMRELWTNELVDFTGKYHSVTQAGINPLPVQRPIPVWMGGGTEPVLKRIARVADGWFPQFRPGPQAADTLERLRGYIRDAGRRAEDVGIEGRISLLNTPENEWSTALAAWSELRATHLSVNTMGVRLATPQAHIDALQRFAKVAKGLAGQSVNEPL